MSESKKRIKSIKRLKRCHDIRSVNKHTHTLFDHLSRCRCVTMVTISAFHRGEAPNKQTLTAPVPSAMTTSRQEVKGSCHAVAAVGQQGSYVL